MWNRELLYRFCCCKNFNSAVKRVSVKKKPTSSRISINSIKSQHFFFSSSINFDSCFPPTPSKPTNKLTVMWISCWLRSISIWQTNQCVVMMNFFFGGGVASPATHFTQIIIAVWLGALCVWWYENISYRI